MCHIFGDVFFFFFWGEGGEGGRGGVGVLRFRSRHSTVNVCVGVAPSPLYFTNLRRNLIIFTSVYRNVLRADYVLLDCQLELLTKCIMQLHVC